MICSNCSIIFMQSVICLFFDLGGGGLYVVCLRYVDLLVVLHPGSMKPCLLVASCEVTCEVTCDACPILEYQNRSSDVLQ